MFDLVAQTAPLQRSNRANWVTPGQPVSTDEPRQSLEQAIHAAFEEALQRQRERAGRDAEHAALMAAFADRSRNIFYVTNIQALDYEQTKSHIELSKYYIEKSETDKFDFRGADGDVEVNDIKDYLRRLLIREKEFTNDGTYTPTILTKQKSAISVAVTLLQKDGPASSLPATS